MKFAVIDVGSNSVRLMLSDGVKTFYKRVKTTRLAEGLGEEKTLKEQPVFRTVQAISDFVIQAKTENADKIYIFATAAVRQAQNKEYFLTKVENACGIKVDVVEGEMEAKLGYMGALNGGDGGVIDVGGASSEIIVVKGGETLYCKSVNIGAVRIKDLAGQDKNAVDKLALDKVSGYGCVPNAQFYAIGGTATTIAAMLQELQPYDPEKTHGYVVCRDALGCLTDKLFSMTVEERKKLKGLQPERAEVIGGGARLLLAIMDKLKITSFTVSESDNLEGYLMTKLEK